MTEQQTKLHAETCRLTEAVAGHFSTLRPTTESVYSELFLYLSTECKM